MSNLATLGSFDESVFFSGFTLIDALLREEVEQRLIRVVEGHLSAVISLDHPLIIYCVVMSALLV